MGSTFADIRTSERDLARMHGFSSAVPRDESLGDTRVSITAVNEGVAELMRGDNPERVVDQALAATIGGAIRPSVEKMIAKRVGSGSELLGLSAFRTAVTQYLASPAGAQIDAETRKIMLHKLETANRTSAEFSALAPHVSRFAGLGSMSSDTAREVARSEGRGKSSADFAQTFNGGPYAAGTLSSAMQAHVDTAHGITAAHVAGVGNYLHGLGINAPQYAGYFAGSSEAIRNAIRDHIKDGRKVTDDDIKNPKDAKAIIGAIKAGKMKKEDAPPSVRQMIKDMENKGVNTSDPKALDKFFEQNPKVLEEIKKNNAADIANKAGSSQGQIAEATKKREDAEKREDAKAAPAAGKPKPETAKLGLSMK